MNTVTNTFCVPKTGVLQQPIKSYILQPAVKPVKGTIQWYEDKLCKESRMLMDEV
ncbi:MAG: hypothetical protein ACOYBL_06235 [Lachnospiraceae bacterium]|jgi:hypothetical protein